MQSLPKKSNLHIAKITSLLVGLSLFFVIAINPAVGTSRQMPVQKTSQFRRIEQAFSLKLVVTLGGLALICSELWWFVLSQNSNTTD